MPNATYDPVTLEHSLFNFSNVLCKKGLGLLGGGENTGMSNTGPHKEPQIKLISKQSLPGPQRNVVESLKKEGVFKGTFGIK